MIEMRSDPGFGSSIRHSVVSTELRSAPIAGIFPVSPFNTRRGG